ncbi:MAG TPA: hypothetical protein VIK78_04700 [Ruminiclostridium sp.]
MNSYKLFQKFKFILVIIFYIVSLINSFFYMMVSKYENDIAYFLPLIFVGIYYILSIINFINFLSNNHKVDSLGYIKVKYPIIWEKVFSGGFSIINPFSIVMVNFLKGHFDDGNDEIMNNLKSILKKDLYIHIFAFFIIPVVWFTNLIFIYIKL